jgi:glycosyltransferase involved in cell wall biosynthesis
MAGAQRFTLVIPSYWGRKAGEPFNKEDAVYDHPTPLDEEGTLKRALQSVPLLGYEPLNVMVLGASTHPDLEDEVEKRLEDIVAPFRSVYPIAFLSHSHARDMQRMLAQSGPEGSSRMLSLRGYSNIRNLGLVAACLTGADAAVLFDDDEIYEDPSYLEKVAENIGGEHLGRFIGGLAGYYVNPNGDYRIPPNRDSIFAEWPAVEYMNRAFDIIAGEERLQVTPWVFGGNMVIHRELYTKVAFDPHVTRGEDIDYLINAKFLGYDFFLDNTLWIRHLPPPKTAPLWRRFREDLDRFIYTREKLRSQVSEEGCRMVGVDELEPYPGRFLREDLEEMIFRTCVLMGMDYLAKDDKESFSKCMENVLRARSGFPTGLNPFRRYLDWRSRWQEFMDFLSRDGELREYVAGRYF